jgi:putative membrane protein
MGGFGGMGSGGFGFIFMLLILVLAVVGIVYLIRLILDTSNRAEQDRGAENVLNQRYALGEITREEFEEKRKLIRTSI